VDDGRTQASLTETTDHFHVRVDAREMCREQMASWRRPALFRDTMPFLAAVGVPFCLVSRCC
jgi:2-haloacid dehalogenase/putative hydrolase of the HAD superfamily